jgi:hypothetical protein
LCVSTHQTGSADDRQQPRELDLLGQLGATLREAGIRAELRQETAALLAYRPGAELPVWIFIGDGGAFFSWHYGQKRHAVSDVGGAAVVIAAYLRDGDRQPTAP